MKRTACALTGAALLLWSLASWSAPPSRPNILIIVADDLGYTDLGAFGSEIATPNLDALAAGGLRLTNFHTAPTCAPTRAMLLSGTDNHLAGLGSQEGLITDNQHGQPGYEMYLTDRVVTVATLLADAGYRTYMSGKWHLGTAPESWPAERGFGHSFALLQGGGSHFDQTPISPNNKTATYVENGKPVQLPANFYSSDAYAQRLIDFLAADTKDPRPFFAYLAFTAPHWPLQAPDETIARYAGHYDEGYDILQERRLAKAKKVGVVAPDTVAGVRPPGLQKWSDLDPQQQRAETRRMEVYAAMIDRMDMNIGRVMAFLDRTGQRANTLIIFMSDNGAEGNRMETYPSFIPWLAKHYDNRLENIGRRGSFASLGPGWAYAATSPFRLYKGYLSEGGTRASALVNYASLHTKSGINHAYATVMDIAPTLLDLAGVTRPGDRYGNRKVHPIQGVSMLPMLRGQIDTIHAEDEAIGWELFGRRALHRGRWKVLWLQPPYGNGDWQLYDMISDPGETKDLSSIYPEIRRSLIEAWNQYADNSGVILPDRALPY
jgi:arylsulfatase